MAILAVLSLILGVIMGHWVLPYEVSQFIGNLAEYFLYALMLSVGFTVGGNRKVFHQLRGHGFAFLVIPIGTVIGSILAGMVGSLFLSQDLATSTAITSGMGWYSLVGILLTEMSGPQAGAIGFLANMMREIMAFALVPVLVKYMDDYTAMAPSGATSEDTTLPMIIKHCPEEMAIIAVINGFVCSALVPILVELAYAFL